MKPSPRQLCGLALAILLPCAAQAANVPATAKQQGVDLALQGAGPFYTLRLPMVLQSRTASSDLTDLQVVNARGEVLPFGWVEALPGTSEQHHQLVPIFKLPGAASGAKTTPPRSWMLDARRISGSLLRLDLSLPENARGVYTLSVETSADLNQWHTLQTSVQVLSLEHQGQRLTSTSIDLGGVRGGYFRLTAMPQSPLPELQSAQITSVNEVAESRPVQWSDPISASACGPQYCDYPMPRNVPLEQVQIQLAEPNTIARVQLLGEMDAAIPVEEHRRRQLLRNPITALRHKSEPASVTRTPNWDALNTVNVYWLKPREGEVRSGAFWMSGGLYSSLRVQTQGPINQLGATPPSVRVGARMPMMVFLMRGPAPYRLVWGDPRTAQAAMPLSQLMPTRKTTDSLPDDSADIVAPAALATPAAASVTAPASAAPDSKPVWLWAVLLAGLAAMGFMAWSLLRKAPKQAA
jgi:hypothetical protein